MDKSSSETSSMAKNDGLEPLTRSSLRLASPLNRNVGGGNIDKDFREVAVVMGAESKMTSEVEVEVVLDIDFDAEVGAESKSACRSADGC